jgi:hypothetical protein
MHNAMGHDTDNLIGFAQLQGWTWVPGGGPDPRIIAGPCDARRSLFSHSTFMPV